MQPGTPYGDPVVQDPTKAMFRGQEARAVSAAAYAGHRVDIGEDVVRLRPSAQRERPANPGQRKGTEGAPMPDTGFPRQMPRMISCGPGGTSSWPR
jgi:hypothetical protein